MKNELLGNFTVGVCFIKNDFIIMINLLKFF